MLDAKPKAGIITTGLLMGLVLSSLDQTIVSTAMPTVVKGLGGLPLYSWVFAIYMLVSTITMPIYGKLADLFGRKRMYLMGLFLFLLGSVLCGLAGTMRELIVFRGIQGLGAGALMPIAMTIVGDIYPPEKRGRFMGLFGAVFAICSILGPMLGGLIVEHISWGWIFYVNLPIGMAAFYLIAVSLKESKSDEKRSIDWLGAITLSGAIGSILLALVLGGNEQGQGAGAKLAWDSPEIVVLFCMGAILLALFIWIETQAKEPIIPLQLFGIRAIAFGNMAGFFMSAGMFGAIVYIPLFVQGVIGGSSSITGYILTPLMLSTIITSTAGGRLMSRLTFRMILIPSLALMAVGFFFLSQLTVDTSRFQIVMIMIITGLGMGAVYPALGTAAQSAVDSRSRGVATSSSQFFRSMGGTIGVSVLGSLLSQRMAAGLTELNSKLGASFSPEQLQHYTNPQVLLDSNASSLLPQEVILGLRHVYSEALAYVFLAGLVFVGLGLVASFFLGNARLIPKPASTFAKKTSNV
ncbi:MDR family MFS transporter [Paenibacillus eucommiae]|uniref:EmrB/QacA subfamily drug resistance transporter n=1 Tax=Paenibacillus eucommiae TaxID=1355755 RepID=A0ABS4IY05_9BACL|nr:MDR family MFS transporter [Paenibacillus eucommiae]MBP1991861.1 EmrB/QacA subfamily drug resistance transporter [Paenibacillus eucommiae]